MSFFNISPPPNVFKVQKTSLKPRATRNRQRGPFQQPLTYSQPHRNAESAFKGYKKQAAKALEAQKKAKNKMALTVVELKQAKKQLEAKEAEKSQAKQVAYDAGMTKPAEILTA